MSKLNVFERRELCHLTVYTFSKLRWLHRCSSWAPSLLLPLPVAVKNLFWAPWWEPKDFFRKAADLVLSHVELTLSFHKTWKSLVAKRYSLFFCYAQIIVIIYSFLLCLTLRIKKKIFLSYTLELILNTGNEFLFPGGHRTTSHSLFHRARTLPYTFLSNSTSMKEITVPPFHHSFLPSLILFPSFIFLAFCAAKPWTELENRFT